MGGGVPIFVGLRKYWILGWRGGYEIIDNPLRESNVQVFSRFTECGCDNQRNINTLLKGLIWIKSWMHAERSEAEKIFWSAPPLRKSLLRACTRILVYNQDLTRSGRCTVNSNIFFTPACEIILISTILMCLVLIYHQTLLMKYILHILSA